MLSMCFFSVMYARANAASSDTLQLAVQVPRCEQEGLRTMLKTDAMSHKQEAPELDVTLPRLPQVFDGSTQMLLHTCYERQPALLIVILHDQTNQCEEWKGQELSPTFSTGQHAYIIAHPSDNYHETNKDTKSSGEPSSSVPGSEKVNIDDRLSPKICEIIFKQVCPVYSRKPGRANGTIM